MLNFLLRRIVLLIPVILGVILLVFRMSKVTPGDPAVLLLGDEASSEDVARLRDPFDPKSRAI